MKRYWLSFSFFFLLFFFFLPTTEAAAYSPHNIDQNVWEKRNSIRGDRSADFSSGRKLIYDVYEEKDGKQGWRVENRDFGKGSQPYLTFTGWSAIVGRHSHYWYNQSTHIMAKNFATGEEKMYRAEMTTLDATEDVEYNKKASGPNDIWNPCPDGTLNKRNDECNMYYKNVGFKAYLPLQELFPNNSNGDWTLYIVKDIGGHIVYDTLIVPFQFQDIAYANGKLSLSSGQNASVLVMNSDGVIRRTYPRSTESGWPNNYFNQWFSYSRVAQDQKNTAVWYGVSDGTTRWASSPYWTFGGTVAKLSFRATTKTCPDGAIVPIDQPCTVNVTIHHKDKETGTILRTDKKKATVGQAYNFVPEAKGVFKDKKGLEYVPTPKGQTFSGTTPNNNLTHEFYYKTAKPNPSEIIPVPGTTEGNTKGQAFWELRRVNDKEASQVYGEVNFSMTGKHYATRNFVHQTKIGTVMEQKERPIAVLMPGVSVKGKTFDYNVQYEYTNHARTNYKCVDAQDSDCFRWEYVNTTPVWEKPYGKTYSLAETQKKGSVYVTIPIIHQQGETLEKDTMNEVLEQKWLIGKKDTWDNGSLQTKDYFEQWKRDSTNATKEHYDLKTQTTLPITPGKLVYEMELPSDEHKKSTFNGWKKARSNGFYFPSDVDDSLKEDYQNQSTFDYGKYAFPLQQHVMKDKGMNNGKRVYEWDYVTDVFFMAQHTGFVTGIPYASQVKEALLAGKTFPTFETMLERGKEKMNKDFKEQTGQILKDDILSTSSKEWDLLQRYAIPISPTSTLKPNETYENKTVLQNMGLSDATFIFGQTFAFEHYLFGSAMDDAWIIEQPDPRVKMDDVKQEDIHRITIKHEDKEKVVKLLQERPDERLHKFRVTDRDFVDKMKRVLDF